MGIVDDPFRGFGVEITLDNEDDFLKVKETLTRIGICNKKQKTLFQSCHILHKSGRYAIIHFKEMYALDSVLDKGIKSKFFDNVSEDDISRRNKIVKILAEWGLLREIDPKKTESPICDMSNIKVLRYSEIEEWNLEPKYIIGKYKRTNPEC